MDADREHSRGRVPLPWQEEPAPAQRPEPAVARENGIRHLRRMSAWSAAALIVGTGAATVAFAHGYAPASHAAGTTPAATGAGGTTAPAAGAGGTSAVHRAGGPAVTHSVATTSGSGATVTTTTRTVGGRTIVTHVRHAAVYHDN